MLFSTNCSSSSLYFSTATFHPNKTVKKKKSRKCKKQGIKNFSFLYYIQAKCSNIADKNPNLADDNEWTFNHRWPNLWVSFSCNFMPCSGCSALNGVNPIFFFFFKKTLFKNFDLWWIFVYFDVLKSLLNLQESLYNSTNLRHFTKIST